MTGTDLCVNMQHCVPVIFEPPCTIQVRYKLPLKRLQMDKIGYIPELNQITRTLLSIKTVFLYKHTGNICVKQV
jgi:hypothetical protein